VGVALVGVVLVLSLIPWYSGDCFLAQLVGKQGPPVVSTCLSWQVVSGR